MSKIYAKLFAMRNGWLTGLQNRVSHRVMYIENLRSTDARQRLNRLAFWLDEAFVVPGTSIRFGWDAIIGLIPGFGDLIATALSLYIFGEALAMGAPKVVLLRMLGNIGIESFLGSFPIFGDLFDVFFKANKRNAEIIGAYLDHPVKTKRRSAFVVWGVVSLLLFTFMLMISALITGLIWIISSLVS